MGAWGGCIVARDLRHQRQVAIKVLHPEIASVLGPERFLREIAFAAGFLHPNILPLYDSGSRGRALLRHALRGRRVAAGQARPRGPAPVEDAIRIAGDVAAALDYAHGHGVVHRDVKPENILLSAGRAMLADFGLAMSLEDGARDGKPHSGYVIGTPSYMSPEQAAPGGQLDGRADIYALGCVVYEMLAGEPPFAGATDRAVLARHSVDPVPPLRTIRPGIPEELEQAVLKALAKVPADRPAEAGRFAASLIIGRTASGSRPRRPARIVGRFLPLIGLLLAAAIPFALESRPAPTRAEAANPFRPRVSVGSFVNRTGDPTLDPLGALAESWLTWGLAASGTVEVVYSTGLAERTPAARGRPTGTRPAGAPAAGTACHGALLPGGQRCGAARDGHRRADRDRELRRGSGGRRWSESRRRVRATARLPGARDHSSGSPPLFAPWLRPNLQRRCRPSHR